LYYFAKFTIVNELLIIEDRRISAHDRIEPSQPDARPHARDRPLSRRCEERKELFTNDNGAYRLAPNGAVAAGLARADPRSDGGGDTHTNEGRVRVARYFGKRRAVERDRYISCLCVCPLHRHCMLQESQNCEHCRAVLQILRRGTSQQRVEGMKEQQGRSRVHIHSTLRLASSSRRARTICRSFFANYSYSYIASAILPRTLIRRSSIINNSLTIANFAKLYETFLLSLMCSIRSRKFSRRSLDPVYLIHNIYVCNNIT